MHGVRAIMSRIYYDAEGHGRWEEGKRSPASSAKLGKRRYAYERRILSFEETADVLQHLEEPNKLIVETCIATGARISEVLGLKWKHVDFKASAIKIEQRVWQQDVGRPKSEDSRRVLGLGELVGRAREKANADAAGPTNSYSNRSAHQASRCGTAVCVTPYIKRRKQRVATFQALVCIRSGARTSPGGEAVGGSAIEASKIAGHRDLEMTSPPAAPSSPQTQPSLVEAPPATVLIQ